MGEMPNAANELMVDEELGDSGLMKAETDGSSLISNLNLDI